MPDIFINTQRPVDRSQVAGKNQPQREAPAGAFVAGSSYDINLYFVLNDGTYDSRSGGGTTDVQLAVGTIATPQSGSFTITDGTDTATIEYGASAQAVEDALNALNSDTGPNVGTASLVDVEKQSDTQYTITWRTLGAMTALSGASVSLHPESTPSASIAVAGSSTTYAQQVIEVTRQPAIYEQTWSTITNGHSATVAFNTTRLLQSMVLEQGEPFWLEIKLDGETVCREVVSVEESNMPASAFSGTAIKNLLDEFAADPTSNASFNAAAWAAEIAAGGTVTSVNGETGVVVLDMDDFAETATNKILTSAERAEIAANTAASHDAVTVTDSAEIDFTLTGQDITASLIAGSIDETKLDASTNASLDLADSASQPGHTHTASDIDAEASADGYVLTSDGAGNAAWEASTGGSGHDPVTVTDSAEIDFTLTGQDITASLIASSIDETKLDASTNASLDLADSASQPGHTHTASDVTDFDSEVSNNTTVAGNEAYTPRVISSTAKTATFTAVVGETHLINTSAGGFTADLPAIASGQGRIAFYFTGTGNSLTVDPNASETIDGKATIKLDHGHNTIENDGTEWKLVQRSGISPNRLDPAQITANQDGYNPTDWTHGVTHLYIDSDASREIQGFEEDGFHDMEQVVVTNDGANDIVIKHDTATTVANRVLVDGNADFTLGANQTGILMRDGTANKWRFYGVTQDLTNYQIQPAEGAFVDGDKTKLDGIQSVIGFALSDETSALTTGQKIATDMPVSMNVKRVYASVGTAGGTSAITIDVEDEGVTILNAVVSISAGANNAETTTFTGAASNYQLTKGDALTIDVDSIDDGTANGLKVYLIGDITA